MGGQEAENGSTSSGTRGGQNRKAVRSLVAVLVVVIVAAAAWFLSREVLSSRGCTYVGCTSGVSIDLARIPDIGASATVQVHACVNDTCVDQQVRTTPVGGPGGTVIPTSVPGSPGPSITSASVRVTDANGRVLVDQGWEGDETAHSRQPNGPDCEPTCYTFGFAVTADGHLAPGVDRGGAIY